MFPRKALNNSCNAPKALSDPQKTKMKLIRISLSCVRNGKGGGNDLERTELMRIISRRIIRKFCEKHSDATSALDRWYSIMKKAEVSSFIELRFLFSNADKVGKYVVFNIGGNKYRLIAHIHFNTRVIYVRDILTHEEYDRDTWKE